MTNLDRDRVESVFGDRTGLAERFVELLAVHGVDRGLIGPREVDRLWDRHVLNSAVVAEVLPEEARVVDVGSGAGLPGIPLAIARPDLSMTLVEPMARRVAWLTEVVETLGLSSVVVVRGRAEEPALRGEVTGTDVVTARAVAPLGKLGAWCLPLLRIGGRMVALKGASASEEINRDRAEIRRAGGGDPRIVRCGVTVVDPPTTVVVVERLPRKDQRARRG
ncbi:16S rRNA (guanine(527)-N(7))-methyltransferase RsmG [Actinokineospora sp. 24-640]